MIDYTTTKTWDESIWPFNDLDSDPIEWFVIGQFCDCINGCPVCNYTMVIRLYFNSEFTEQNVIGINERMVND